MMIRHSPAMRIREPMVAAGEVSVDESRINDRREWTGRRLARVATGAQRDTITGTAAQAPLRWAPLRCGAAALGTGTAALGTGRCAGDGDAAPSRGARRWGCLAEDLGGLLAINAAGRTQSERVGGGTDHLPAPTRTPVALPLTNSEYRCECGGGPTHDTLTGTNPHPHPPLSPHPPQLTRLRPTPTRFNPFSGQDWGLRVRLATRGFRRRVRR